LRVAICVGTFQRTELLRKLLHGLSALRFTKVSRPQIEVIIVDNDAAQSARAACDYADFPWKLRYLSEPRRGIAKVRNRAVSEVGDADFIAFLDDDETPSPEWLDELLCTQAQSLADVVAGRVMPVYSEEVPGWIRTGKFFDRLIEPTGRSIELCSTNNVLIRRDILNTIAGFDEQFDLTGGEDTHFFLRIQRSGFRMVASREAAVYESVSRIRANSRWILRRGFQSGNSWALCERDLDPRPRTAIARCCKAIIHIVVGLVKLIPGVVSGKAQTVNALRQGFLGAGMLAGVVGHRFLPYRLAGSDSIKETAASSAQG
jgi:GT2 family glycosyltransferase